jgi:DNA-binding transcriptional ArsR family regulator
MLRPDLSDTELPVDRPLSEIKAELFKALGHPGRIRILEVLSDQPHTVTEMVPLVGLEASHLSQQLAILRRSGVVTVRREGTTATYTLASGDIAELLVVAKRFLLDGLRVRQQLFADVNITPLATPRRR